MDLGLAGKVVLITSIGGWRGTAVARAFLAEGAKVAGCDLDSTPFAGIENSVRPAEESLSLSGPLDVADPTATARWVTDTVDRWGRVDIVVNNAAPIDPTPFPELDASGWIRAIHAELSPAYVVSQAAWPHMVAAGAGLILNIASASAHQEIRPMRSVAHRAAQGALLALTRTLAAEGAPHGIRALSLSSGMIRSSSSRPMWDGNSPIGTTLLGKIPLGRFGDCDELARLAVFLSSDGASYMTASDVIMDGGLLGVSWG